MCKLRIIMIQTIAMFILNIGDSMAYPFFNKDSVITYNNSQITLQKTKEVDVLRVIDPITGKESIKKIPVLEPVRIDSFIVHKENAPYTFSEKLEKILIKEITQNLTQNDLPNGFVNVGLRNIVVNSKGELIYYEITSIDHVAQNQTRKLSNDLVSEKTIIKSINQLPINGNNSYLKLRTNLSKGTFEISEGVVKYKNK